MAVTLTGDYSGNTAGGSTITLSVTRASGEGFLLCAMARSSTTVSSVVWDSAGDNQALTLIASQQHVGGGTSRWSYTYYLAAPTSVKTGDVVVTFSGSSTSSIALLRKVSGHSTSAMIRANTVKAADGSTTPGDGVNPFGSTITSQVDDLCVDFMAYRNDVLYFVDGNSYGTTKNAGQSNLASVGSGSVISIMSTQEAGAASVDMGWTYDGSSYGDYDYSYHILSVAPSAATTSALRLYQPPRPLIGL